jgi:hypothetical protein
MMTPLLLIAIVLGAGIQRERIVTPSEQTADETRFLDQLRSIFGRFSNADLQGAFARAAPIRCSELVNNRGIWKTVAFFNQDRPALGAWYRSSLEEVRRDLDAYVFNGLCNGERGSLWLTTKFPVVESIEAFHQRRIDFDEIDVNVNAVVAAAFDSQTGSYAFDLPYLFYTGVQDGVSVYSLHPPRLETRDRYARAVAAHFDCKAVRSADVTCQFLICRDTLRFSNAPGRLPRRSDVAYYILSDGKEATSSVKLSLDGANPLDEDAAAVPRASPTPATRVVGRVVREDNQTSPVDQDSVRLSGNGPPLFAAIRPDGSFEFESVQPGVYQVVVGPRVTMRPVEVPVGGSHVAGLRLVVPADRDVLIGGAVAPGARGGNVPSGASPANPAPGATGLPSNPGGSGNHRDGPRGL